MDRGAWGVETLTLLLTLKLALPGYIHLLRGNHESAMCTRYYGFMAELQAKYGKKAKVSSGVAHAFGHASKCGWKCILKAPEKAQLEPRTSHVVQCVARFLKACVTLVGRTSMILRQYQLSLSRTENDCKIPGSEYCFLPHTQ